MPADSLFTQLPSDSATSVIEFDGQSLTVPSGISLASALLISGVRTNRTTPVNGNPRAPYCLMGVCFECLVEIDGLANCQACMITVRDGMRVSTQRGARSLGLNSHRGDEEHDA